tara:strand:+ start:194 stop:610 length:417 start_codon:yes stop_codon:yes gene_type:complete
MKTILSYFTFFLTGVLLQAQNTINVEMSGFESNKGKANIGLFNEEQTFLREANWKRFSEINNYKATATFTDIPDGIYAVSVYHDENDNEKLDLIMGMIPKEDTGTSNNPKVKMGPPKWEESIFEAKGGQVVNLKIIIN